MDIAEEEFIQDHGPGPESTAIRSEEHKLLRESMESINPLDRAALILRYWYDLSDREISETLSLSVSAVKSRLHRARLALAKNWPDPATNPSRTERKKYESPAF
jgi:RNA polymerase sigma-70 factor (ECF subfamily)